MPKLFLTFITCLTLTLTGYGQAVQWEKLWKSNDPLRLLDAGMVMLQNPDTSFIIGGSSSRFPAYPGFF